MENDRAGKVKKKKKEAEDMEQELLQEIASYWGTRAEGYSEVNEKELAGSQREAWLHVLEEQFPEKKKEEMKILDIGTGPGFFPMILSEAGYTVTAVDYTEEMLEKAKENLGKYTKYGLERVTLQRMDAQNLEFADETFDVVISRNLTWNLEKPEQAYQEWMRVLKPGGVLLNFDANWYGYLYDEEKKEAYEADRKKVEEQQLDDHYLCTDIDRMENIARQVPLSAMERPAWDTKVLESLGVCSIQTDSEIWKRVWSEEERLNYASTPMFLVRAEKSAEQSFQLGDVTVRRGEKYQGDISFANGDIVLPGTIICGKLPGKTMLITGGVHSGEYVGIQACVELGAELQPEKTVGTIVILKVLNRPAFENRAGSLGLSDGKNLNRVFPGNPNGTEMERLAWAITKEVYPKVDYYIDLHSGDDFEASDAVCLLRRKSGAGGDRSFAENGGAGGCSVHGALHGVIRRSIQLRGVQRHREHPLRARRHGSLDIRGGQFGQARCAQYLKQPRHVSDPPRCAELRADGGDGCLLSGGFGRRPVVSGGKTGRYGCRGRTARNDP